MTTGLLLLTTDGEAVHRLTHPRYHIPRRYTALVHGRSTAEIAEAVKRKTVIDGRPVAPSEVRVRPGTEGRSILDVTLAEGRNRIVRRWARPWASRWTGSPGSRTVPCGSGDLPPGRYRPLTPREEAALYKAVRMDADPE